MAGLQKPTNLGDFIVSGVNYYIWIVNRDLGRDGPTAQPLSISDLYIDIDAVSHSSRRR